MVLEALIAGGVGLGLVLYKKFAHAKLKAFLKKHLDDPTTKEDESAVVFHQLDGFAQDVVKIAVTEAIKAGSKEALKNPHVDKAVAAAEHLHEKMAGKISMEDAKKLVDAALRK